MEYGADGMSVDVIIYGGGLCGVLAGHRCVVEGLTYKIIEKESDFGGVWHTLANEHSHLQAFEAMYRWHKDYPLGSNPLAKLSGPTVLTKIREFARDFSLHKSTYFDSIVLSTRLDKEMDRYVVNYKDTTTGSTKIAHAKFIIVTTGILGLQYTPQERGYKGMESFQGVLMLAGRHNGRDSFIGNINCAKKVVVVIGSGAFACEAMEAAVRGGAEHVHVISRPRARWVLPFSRQFTTTFVSYAPLLPWQAKMALLKAYLRYMYYLPCGIPHMMPAHDVMDYTGQCNDAFFSLAKCGKVSYIVDDIKTFTEKGICLLSNTEVHSDIIVLAAGCKYTSRPSFLEDVNTGFDDLYNYAFMGPTARIGTASDFVFGFVPDGPKKQLDLIFHGIKCYNSNLFEAFKRTLRPVSLPIHADASAGLPPTTWFSTRAWYSNLNMGIQERTDIYINSMSVGLDWFERQKFRCIVAAQQLKFWAIAGVLSLIEVCTLPVYGK